MTPRPAVRYFDAELGHMWGVSEYDRLPAVSITFVTAETLFYERNCCLPYSAPDYSAKLQHRPIPAALRDRMRQVEFSSPGYNVWRYDLIQGEWPFDCLEASEASIMNLKTGDFRFDTVPTARTKAKILADVLWDAGVDFSWSLSPSILTRNILILLAASALLTTCSRSTYTFLLHRHRRARNRCLPCGYPRPDATSPCPECGESVPVA